MGYALKIQSILGKGFLKIKCMIEKIILVFILSIILQHPVNPVIYMDVVYAGFAWSKNLSEF